MQQTPTVIRAVSFDLDGTLVHIPDAGPRFLARVYRVMGLRYSYQDIAGCYPAVEREWTRIHPVFTLRRRSIYVDFHRRLLLALGATGNLDRMARQAVAAWNFLAARGAERLYPDVRSTLRCLQKRGLRLAVVTHRPRYSARQTLRRLKIGRYFKCVVAPDALGIKNGKFCVRLWQCVLQCLEVRADQLLHVDNDYECGVKGPGRAGVRAVLLSRRSSRNAGSCPVIADLHALPVLLDKAQQVVTAGISGR